MSVWLVEPLDPLIARDGRPAAVGRFDTMDFPFPSMIAGAVRTRMGSQGGAFVIPSNALEELKEKIPVQGPLLAELNLEGGELLRWLAPAPFDAVFLRVDDTLDKLANLRRLVPHSLGAEESMDSLPGKGLLPVSFQSNEPYGKPPANLPAFWTWSEFENWLTHPGDRAGVDLSSWGLRSLPVERRAHLALQPNERVGIDGMLFQTAGLRLLQEGASPLGPRRFALSLRCKEASVANRRLELERQIAPLGGERRLALWSPATSGWPQMPEAIRKSIVDNRRARLILLTPAIFTSGALPSWNGKPWPLGGAIEATVRAACVPRPKVVSGWDLATGRAKESRRLAAAGSVYFLELTGGNENDLRRWCDETWLTCVSDDPKERRDGFGLAALGTWEDAL
jgi:CRISPR-associated protein Cmr3